jgi:hypothetical protein
MCHMRCLSPVYINIVSNCHLTSSRHNTFLPLRPGESLFNPQIYTEPTAQTLITTYDTSPIEAMDPAGTYHDNADMQDVRNHYDEIGQLGQGPYFDILNLDPSLSNVLDHDMANIHLGGTNGISPTQAYGGEVSSEVVTPPKSNSAACAKKGNKAQVAQAEGPGSEVTSEEDDDDEEEEEEEEEEDEEEDEEEEEEDDFESADEEDYEEPVIRKHCSATKIRTPISKSSKATPKSSARARKTPRRGAKVKEAMPFNRQRRAPKNGIMDSRPIPRSYDECDEADKALLDMRDEEKKTWKQIRAVWEELTGQKTGTSTLPNRYE